MAWHGISPSRSGDVTFAWAVVAPKCGNWGSEAFETPNETKKWKYVYKTSLFVFRHVEHMKKSVFFGCAVLCLWMSPDWNWKFGRVLFRLQCSTAESSLRRDWILNGYILRVVPTEARNSPGVWHFMLEMVHWTMTSCWTTGKVIFTLVERTQWVHDCFAFKKTYSKNCLWCFNFTGGFTLGLDRHAHLAGVRPWPSNVAKQNVIGRFFFFFFRFKMISEHIQS